MPPEDLYDISSRANNLFHDIEDENIRDMDDSDSDGPRVVSPILSSPMGSNHQQIDDPPSRAGSPAALPPVDNLATPPLPPRNPPIHISPFPPRIPPLEAYTESHNKWYIRAVLLLAVFLHTKHHVTFRASNILLYTLRVIFKSLNLIDPDNDMPITLNTVIKRLDFQDRFVVLPACPLCHRHFPADTPDTFLCPKCDVSLFSTASHTLFQRMLGREPSKPPPKLSVPVSPLSEQLGDFFSQPGMEHIVEEWRDRPRSGDELNSMMDGRVWNEIPGPDGKPFFDKESLTEPTEIRLGVTFALDW